MSHDFKSVHLVTKTLDEMWFNLLVELTKSGGFYKITEGSFKDDFRLEFDFVSGTIMNPIQYSDTGIRLPLAVSVPPGCPAPTTDSGIEDYFVNYLMDGNKSPNEDYRYSSWIRGGMYNVPRMTVIGNAYMDTDAVKSGDMIEGIEMNFNDFTVKIYDQLQWCIDHFKKKGYGNNHCYIQVGYPESNLAYDKKYMVETERRTSPCLRGIGLKIKKSLGKEYLLVDIVYRSWDLYSGFPENVGGLILLQEYIANELGVGIGPFSFMSSGLHVYGHAMEALAMRSGNIELQSRFELYKNDSPIL